MGQRALSATILALHIPQKMPGEAKETVSVTEQELLQPQAEIRSQTESTVMNQYQSSRDKSTQATTQ